VVVKERDKNGGYLETRINYIKQRLRSDPDLVWTNQYANKANPGVHESTTAKEIVNAYPDIDYLFVGAGTTGTLMGCAQYFRSIEHKAKVIAVDVVGSVTFNNPPGPRKIPGLGTSVMPPICQHDIVDDVIWVTEEDTIRRCRWYARKYGMLLGGSSGSVLAGIQSYKGKIPRGSTVVTISPDYGDKYVSTIYSDTWVNTHFPEVLRANETELLS
jgi:cysteine synthase